jgi:hypothetical protein
MNTNRPIGRFWRKYPILECGMMFRVGENHFMLNPVYWSALLIYTRSLFKSHYSTEQTDGRVRCPNTDGKLVIDLVGFGARLCHSRSNGFCARLIFRLLFQTRYPRPFSHVPSRRYEPSPLEMSLLGAPSLILPASGVFVPKSDVLIN